MILLWRNLVSGLENCLWHMSHGYVLAVCTLALWSFTCTAYWPQMSHWKKNNMSEKFDYNKDVTVFKFVCVASYTSSV